MASLQIRSSTALNAGSWNGVKVPLRASISQAIASARTEKMRAKPQQQRCGASRAAFSGRPSGGALGVAGSNRAMRASVCVIWR